MATGVRDPQPLVGVALVTCGNPPHMTQVSLPPPLIEEKHVTLAPEATCISIPVCVYLPSFSIQGLSYK